ncbi:MAG: translocation/assembly module TamB domain-containing protein, partial [Burkholderiales bacterium]
VFTSGDTRLEAQQVALAYAVDAREHRLTIEHAESEAGVLHGRIALGADAPFPIDGLFSLTGRFEAYPYALRGTLAGTLGEIHVVAANSAPPLVADVDAIVTPFAEVPVREARVRAESVDVRAFDAGLPGTDLAVEIDVRPLPDGRFAGQFHIANRAAGPLDRERIPLTDATGRFEGTPANLALDALAIDLGKGGRLSGRGGLDAGHLYFDLQTPALNLKALHDKLKDTKLAGALRLKASEEAQTLTVDLSQQGYRIEGEVVHGGEQVDLRSARVRAKGGEATAQGRLALTGNRAFSATGSVARFDPSAFGDFPGGSVNGGFTVAGSLSPRLAARVNVNLAEPSRFRGAPLAGSVRFDLSEQRIAEADVALRLGANRINAQGSFGNPGDRLTWNIDVTDPAVIDPRLAGTLAAEGVVEGTPAQPAGRFTVEGKALRWENELSIAELSGSGSLVRGLDGDIQLALQARDVKRGTQQVDKASVTASGTLAKHDIQVTAAGPAFDAATALTGAWSNGAWTGRITSLGNRGQHPVQLLDPATIEIGSGRFILGATRLRFGDGTLNIAGVRSIGGTLETSGDFSGMAVAYLLRPAPDADAVEATLKLGGRWNLRADQTLDCSVAIGRESGDILLPTRPPTALGLDKFELGVQCEEGRVRATLDAAGSDIGTVTATVETRASRSDGVWSIPRTAPLKVDARASVPSLAWVGALTEDAVAIAGKLDVAVAGSGTVAAPGLQGTVTGSGIEVGLPELGVFLADGTLRGTFEQDRFILNEFTLHGGEGTLVTTGVYDFTAGGGLKLTLVADRLALLTRPDQKLVVSGNIDGSVIDGALKATGKITADSARIEVLPSRAPTLSSDIVVRGQEADAERRASRNFADIDLELDLGTQFYVNAFGLDGRLVGSIQLRARDRELPKATGSIRVVQGYYTAFGQRLTVERGILTFSGPIDNPGINALAMRKNQAVEAGVSVTGTLRMPTVKLVSVPEVPDTEKLSWLMLGRAPDPNARDNEALTAAAASLIAAGGSSLLGIGTKGLGIDSVGMRTESGTSGQILSFGKRISDNVYLTYERSVSGAVNLTRVRYVLSPRWSIEAATGTSDAIDIFFTLFFN